MKNLEASQQDSNPNYFVTGVTIAIAAGSLVLGLAGAKLAEGEADCIRTDETIWYPDFAACNEDLFGVEVETISKQNRVKLFTRVAYLWYDNSVTRERALLLVQYGPRKYYVK